MEMDNDFLDVENFQLGGNANIDDSNQSNVDNSADAEIVTEKAEEQDDANANDKANEEANAEDVASSPSQIGNVIDKDFVDNLKAVIKAEIKAEILNEIKNSSADDSSSDEKPEDKKQDSENEAEEQCAEKPVEKEEEKGPDFTELIRNVWGHSRNMKQIIQAVKVKDANLNKVLKELQMYRDGYEKNLFKSISLGIINLRESNRKAIFEFGESNLTSDNAKKYLKYIAYDVEDFISETGIEIKDDSIFYNGKNINNVPEKKLVAPEIAEPEIDEIVPDGVVTLENVLDYFVRVEEKAIQLIKANENLDLALGVYIENSESYNMGIQQVVLYPVIRALVSVYNKTSNEIDEAINEVTEENATEVYLKCLQKLVDRLEDVLVLCGVSVDGFVSEVLDSKKHKIIKTLPTDDEALSKTIAKRYTDCYMMDDKIIYQQKVDIYLKK